MNRPEAQPPMQAFVQGHAAWLAQFDNATWLSTLLNLYDSAGFYIVDQYQQILYWSKSAEQLTGLRHEDLVGQACLAQYHITHENNDTVLSVASPQTSHKNIRLKKKSQALFDRNGVFAGGVGILTERPDATPSSFLPKVLATAKQNFHGILSRSPAMQDIFQIIQNSAETEATVLVRGESGSGKELVANAIHTLSVRRHAPFLAINCAALSSNLLESELFGHVRGAFTGAIKEHSGLFQRANGGTLFLDEVAELPLALQAKLLRVLQERNYIPVGGDHSIDVDVRIVAATHRSLREEVKLGRFREDLMYRLRVVPIFLPPLRERREDISLLVWHFISQHNDERVRIIEKIDPPAMKILLDYAWPGNVRELHNVVEYAFAVGRGSTLRLSELPPEFREQRIEESSKKLAKPSSSPLTAENELTAIREALAQSQGRAGEAAALLGMSRATFWRKRKALGL